MTALILLVPWTARNYEITEGKIVLTSLRGGVSLYEACGPGADDRS